MVQAALKTADHPGTFTHVEVAEVIFTFWCCGKSKQEVVRQVEEHFARFQEALAGLPVQQGAETGSFLPPRLEWLDWQLVAPETSLGWCGAFQIVLASDRLDQFQGCIWDHDSLKHYVPEVSRQVDQAFPHPEWSGCEAAGLCVDSNPFVWVVGLGTRPEVEWTAELVRRHGRCLAGLTVIRSRDWQHYTDREIEAILADNLAFTTAELQLLRSNSGFLYMTSKRAREQGGLDYLHRAVIEANAVLRAIRGCLMQFRVELHGDANRWWAQRVHGRGLRRAIRELLHHSRTASEILRQVDARVFASTRKIGYEQSVFQKLFQRYGVGDLADGLRQQLQQVNAQISELTQVLQNQGLSIVKLLVLVPALWFAYQFLKEAWPWLQQADWQKLWQWWTG